MNDSMFHFGFFLDQSDPELTTVRAIGLSSILILHLPFFQKMMVTTDKTLRYTVLKCEEKSANLPLLTSFARIFRIHSKKYASSFITSVDRFNN